MKKTMHDLILRGLGMALVACGALIGATQMASRAGAADFKMKIATVGLNDIQHEYLREFKRRLEAATGDIAVELYPGAQLGSIADTIRGLQLGTVEMFIVPPDFLKGVDTRFQVASAPGLFADIPHAHRAFTDPEFRDVFLAVGVAKGIKGVSIWDSGAIDYATMSPVRKLSDFKGQKIRVLASEIETRMMARFGAAGVPMDIIEVLPALQRGALDGIRSVASIMDARKFWTTTKYLTVVNDTHVPLAAYLGMPFYRKLTPALQQTIERIGREIEPLMLERSIVLNAASYDSWKKNGAEIIQLSPEERAEFLKRVSGVADEVMGNDAQLKEIYQLFKKVAVKNRK